MTMSFVSARFAVEYGPGAPFVAFVLNDKDAQTSAAYEADNPYEALYRLSHRLCRHCHKVERKHGDLFCGPCTQVVIQFLGRCGWLTRVPPPTFATRDPPGRYHCGDAMWENVVRAYEECA